MPDLPLGAVIAFDFQKWNLEEEIAIVHEAAIQRIQVYRNVTVGTPAETIRRRAQDAGLVIDSLHGYIELEMLEGPRFDLSAADPAVREASLEIARREADFARALGCRDVILHPAGPGDTQADPFRPNRLADSAERLAGIAGAADVRFLLENMPPPMFGHDARLLRHIVDRLASPHLGLAYDAGHAHVAGRAVQTVHEMGPRLWAIHLHDNHGTCDDHLLPGMGTAPLEDVARALAEVGFAATFMLEIYRDTGVWPQATPNRPARKSAQRRPPERVGAGRKASLPVP